MALPPSIHDGIDDPRLSEQFVRYVPGSEGATSDGCVADRDGASDASDATVGDVLLVGVVHDHPASVARVRLLLEALERHAAAPGVLALELPAAALPLYRVYAREKLTPPRFGGEMSAAIQSVGAEAEVVGIDAPSWSFCRRLCSRLLADRVSPAVARRVLSSLGGATREALTCRLAATLTDATSLTVTAGDAVEYACSNDDSPARQAAHERAHVAGVQALLGSMAEAGGAGDGEAEGHSALAYRDRMRERCMADALEARRRECDVVAVVGVDHLDPLEAALSA